MTLRNSTCFFSFIALLAALFVAMLGHAHQRLSVARPLLEEKATLVRTLELTDLCLFTEASYTRHPSMADRYTALQDYPHAFEHFPSGSLVAPPAHLVGPYAIHH